MWSTVMHNQAKSGSPVWPFVIFVAVMILVLHVIQSSFMAIMPRVKIEEVEKLDIMHHFNQTELAESETIPPQLLLPQKWVTALKHAERQVYMDLKSLQ